MIITNLISSPRANVTLKPGEYTPISTIGKTVGVSYWCTVWLIVTGGSITIDNCPGTFSKNQRIGWSFTSTSANPMSLKCNVVSGSPTVNVENMLLCDLKEYQANVDLIKSLHFFDGDTMPRA